MLALVYWLSTLLFLQTSTSSPIVDGYVDKLSAFPGDSITLFLNSNANGRYTLKLHDLSGKEVVQFSTHVFKQFPQTDKPYENGFGYKVTKRIKLPNLPSGIYMIENKIPLIVKSRNAKIVIVYSVNTVNAYCNSGGKSLYDFNSSDKQRTAKVSFLRPMLLPVFAEAFLRWIPKEKFTDIGYITDLDLEDFNAIKKAKLVIIPGHSEYWTLQARRNFDRFVHSGNNALILSGNTMWWQVRYTKSKEQLICYRDASIDPIKSVNLKTILWRDPTLEYPIISSTGTDFQNGGYGLKKDNGWDGFKIINHNSPLLLGTSLKQGDIVYCPSSETDGTTLLAFANGLPIVDYQALGFYKIEIIGYDLVSRGGKEGVATWIVFKPTRSSGTVINTASTDWCSSAGIGSSSDIQQVTRNMISRLLKNDNVFSDEIESHTIPH